MSQKEVPDSKKLFEEAMRDVVPLKKRSKSLRHQFSASQKNSQDSSSPKRQIPSKTVLKISNPSKKTEYHNAHVVGFQDLEPLLTNNYGIPVSSDMVLSYRAPDVTMTYWQQLREGKIGYQGCLDLHGCTVEQARFHFVRFLTEQLRQRKRCLLIIHGKSGMRAEPPILKNMVFHWLKSLPQVMALHSAIPRHGGTGAVYALLRCK